MKTVTHFGRQYQVAKKEIDGNIYVVVISDYGVGSSLKKKEKRNVVVYASEEDRNILQEGLSNLEKEYDKVSKWEITKRKDIDLDEQVSKTLNKGVCAFERKLERDKEFEEKVMAALEANKEVHEGV